MDAIQQNLSGNARIFGIFSCVLFILAAFAGLDALQSYWRSPSNEVALVGGGSIHLSGPMPKGVTEPQHLNAIWLGTAKISFVPEKDNGEAISGKDLWQATLHAGKVQKVHSGALVIEDLQLGSDAETGTVTKKQNTDLIYSLVIYPNADAMQDAKFSLLERYFGIAGGIVAAVLFAVGAVCAGAYWWLRRTGAPE